MRRRRVVAAAALCVVGCLGVPAGAQPGVLTVSAERGASARFHLAIATTLAFDQARVVTTSADYAGIAVYGDDGRLRGGILTAPATSSAGADLDPVYLGPRNGLVLPRGWYRVVVLANAPTSVRIPVLSGSGVDVTATTPNAQRFAVAARTLSPGGRGTAELRTPLPTGAPGTRVELLTRLSPAVVDGGVTLRVCASRRGRPCARRDTKVTLTTDRTGANATRMVQAGLGTPTRYLTGSRDALATVTLAPAAPVPFSVLFVHWTDPVR
jgi:hypothetical protein